MARYQVNLAYDGTDFLGFQRQGEARTVQAEFENALRQIGWQGKSILCAGRTDSGVHASGQVVAFDFDWKHGCEKLVRALNANLPMDVAAKAAKEADERFHPRFDARSRTYRYQVYYEEGRDPLKERFAWRIYPALEIELLKEAARLLPGIHNFSAFGAPMKAGGSTTREVFRAEWQQEENRLWFEVTANAFLYHMVRRMVYLQVMVGQQQLSLQGLAEAVEEAKPQIPGMAPPQGLVLMYVEFDGEQVNRMINEEIKEQY
jgi:tRNA pseudouridine38-40 synthase